MPIQRLSKQKTSALLTKRYCQKMYSVISYKPQTLNPPEKRTASGGMVDGDLENGRSECAADDCKAIL